MFKKAKIPPERMPRVRPASSQRNTNAAAVFSYHANRSATRPGASGRSEQTKTPLDERRQAAPHSRRGLLVAALIVLLVAALANSYVSSSPQIVIDKTMSTSALLRSPQAYGTAAHAALAQSFGNKLKITANTAAVASSLEAQFPELAHVTVSLPLVGSRPVVHITPATPALLLNSGSALFVLDDSGHAVLDAHSLRNPNALGLPLVTDQSGLQIELGKGALPGSTVAFITEFVGQLNAKRLSVNSLVLPQGTSEVDIKVSGAAYIIKANVRGDGRVEAGAYLAVKQSLEQDHKVPKEYVDVRVDDRAYYK